MVQETGKTIDETAKELEVKKEEETGHLKRRHKWHKIRHAGVASEHKKVPWERKKF
jgi:hypothetical protein